MKQPEVTLLLRLKKEWLIRKAREYNLSTDGSKESLANRIVIAERQAASRAWEAISN